MPGAKGKPGRRQTGNTVMGRGSEGEVAMEAGTHDFTNINYLNFHFLVFILCAF